MQFAKIPKIIYPLQNGINDNILTRHNNYKTDKRRSLIFLEYVDKVIVITILVVTIVGNYYPSTALSGKVIPCFIYIIGVYLIRCDEISIYEL